LGGDGVPGATIGLGADSQIVIAAWIRDLDLGHEEIMIGGEDDRISETHIELDLLARDRTVAAGRLARLRVDPAGLHRVGCSEGAQVGG